MLAFIKTARFINECVKNILVIIPKRRKDGKTDFFVNCRRTYVLNKYILMGIYEINPIFGPGIT